MSAMTEVAGELAGTLVARRWDGGVRVVVQGAMQAIVEHGSVDMVASWRADVFYAPRQRKPSFTLVAETPGQLLRDLAAIVDASDTIGTAPGE